MVFTYLHLAPDPAQTADLPASGLTAIACETVIDRNRGLPPLALADKGWRQAMTGDPHLRAGLATRQRQLSSVPVGEALGLDAVTPEALLGL